MAGGRVVKSLRQHAEEYVAMRRGLGYKLTETHALFSFVKYLEDRKMQTITTAAALSWATETTRSTRQTYWNSRLSKARVFARHMAHFDPATEVPSPTLFPKGRDRTTPHIYGPEEVSALLAACDGLTPRWWGLTFRTLIALLSVTGMRPQEARGLDVGDVDFEEPALFIQSTKFGKSRVVPIHRSTAHALDNYIKARGRFWPGAETQALLLSGHGQRLDNVTVNVAFRQLRQAADISYEPHHRAARLYDFRHTFATTTLLRWYREGEDVAARMPRLSTYLGHINPASTFWYLTGTPELLGLAAERLSRGLGEGS
jgi:integrase